MIRDVRGQISLQKDSMIRLIRKHNTKTHISYCSIQMYDVCGSTVSTVQLTSRFTEGRTAGFSTVLEAPTIEEPQSRESGTHL